MLVDSPGGDPDATFRLVRTLRKYTDSLDVIVVSWSKSAATLLCLGADKIWMGSDAELGPLDAQIRNPKDGKRFSALNTFKSLEYLKQYGIEVLDNVANLFQKGVGMDYIYAVEAARPIVSDMVTALYTQVSPSELGEARRYLAVSEQYGKMMMERYSKYPSDRIESIVRSLVWNYPSHGFVIDFDEAKALGLKVEPLDDECTEACEELLGTVRGCLGIVTDADMPTQETAPAEVVTAETATLPEGKVHDEVQIPIQPDGQSITAATGAGQRR